MRRPMPLVLALCTIGVTPRSAIDAASLAWPHRVSVTAPNGKSAAFRAITLGGELVFQVATKSNPGRWFEPPIPVVRTLRRGDTLKAVTPATYSLNLTRGAVVFFSAGTDSLRVVVGGNPHGALHPVAAQGRKLTVRLVADTVVIDSQ
jgi:hypothetical protein